MLLQDDAVQVKAFPKPKSAMDLVLEMVRAGQQGSVGTAADGGVQQAVQLAAQLGLIGVEPVQMLGCQMPTQAAQGNGIQMMAQMPHFS